MKKILVFAKFDGSKNYFIIIFKLITIKIKLIQLLMLCFIIFSRINKKKSLKTKNTQIFY